MDDKDKQILKILKDDGRAGYGAIGKKVGLSEGAVRKRIKALADLGVKSFFSNSGSLQEDTGDSERGNRLRSHG